VRLQGWYEQLHPKHLRGDCQHRGWRRNRGEAGAILMPGFLLTVRKNLCYRLKIVKSEERTALLDYRLCAASYTRPKEAGHQRWRTALPNRLQP